MYVLSNSAQGFQFLHILTDTCYLLGVLMAVIQGREAVMLVLIPTYSLLLH